MVETCPERSRGGRRAGEPARRAARSPGAAWRVGGTDPASGARSRQERLFYSARTDRSDATHASHRADQDGLVARSEEHTSELQSLMRISYAVFCLKKKK